MKTAWNPEGPRDVTSDVERWIIIEGNPSGELTPPRNKALIAGLIKGNQWVFINPDHKALFFGGEGVALAGGS